jgi:cyclopropane fatty-acyl-phospholipid synthase-like methyltransferase
MTMTMTMPDDTNAGVVATNDALMTRMTSAFERMLGGRADHLHWGLFRRSDLSMREAQHALVDETAVAAGLTPNARVLDVGCGVGGTVVRYHQRWNARATGITNNALGVERAKQNAREKGVEGQVEFVQADGLDNGLPSGTFDAVVMIEAAYMIPDKHQLFSENLRVLKPNGVMIVCDNMQGRRMSFTEIVRYHRAIRALKNTFGEGRYETAETHVSVAREVGFRWATACDLSEDVLPTIDRLISAIHAERAELCAEFGEAVVDDFELAFEGTRMLCEAGVSTYEMLIARK